MCSELSTGYALLEGFGIHHDLFEDVPDLLDVPPFFGVKTFSVPPGTAIDLPRRPRPQPSNVAVPGVRTKPGVVLPVSPHLREALAIAAARGDVVTSGNDGSHLPNSLHFDDLALDLRPAPDLPAQVRRYRNAGYSVLTEGLVDPDTGRFVGLQGKAATGKHLHVSFDPERRRV